MKWSLGSSEALARADSEEQRRQVMFAWLLVGAKRIKQDAGLEVALGALATVGDLLQQD
jgi:hypothetical protein